MVGQKTKLTVYFPSDLHYRLKLRAVEDRTSITELVERAARRLLAGPTRAEPTGGARGARSSLKPGTAARLLGERERLRAAIGTLDVAADLHAFRAARLDEMALAGQPRGPDATDG